MNIPSLHQLFLQSAGVCTDSRKVFKNCIFFALKGENFNGNKYAKEALEKGALHAVIDDPSYFIAGKTTLCKDVLKTLQQMATYHREYLNIPIFSLTGSNGKTTTKELIHAVLSTTYNCKATQGNYNNHIGVPLTLLSMDKDTEIGIVEMGANHQGEIETLSTIARPNYGYITNFGKAHLEGFGGVEGVIKGKSELYRFLKANDGTVFVNGDDPKQMELTATMERIIFNGKDGSYPISFIADTDGLQVSYENETIQTQITGTYNFSNIAIAICIGVYFNVKLSAIKQALESYVPSMNRSQVIEKGKRKIIMDAYNANPSSMKVAIESFLRLKEHPKYVILGDMFELGADAEKEHQEIVNIISKASLAHIYIVGENFYNTKYDPKNISAFDSYEKFSKYLSTHPLPSQGAFFIKGSRGMALERTLDHLR